MNIKLADVLIEGSKDEISLAKIMGQPIKDITGHISNEYGESLFEMSKIIFEDGSVLYAEGEHDCPYLAPYGRQGDFVNKINTLYKEKNGEDDEY